MKKESILNALNLSRTYCVQKIPWFAPVLFNCKIILTEAIEVAAISEDLRVFFNPLAISLTIEQESLRTAIPQLAFLWAHEVSHILREHASRAQDINADPKLWNLAADLEINDSDWKDFTPPFLFPGCFPENYNLPTGQLAEWYYKKLKCKSQDVGANPSDEGSGAHGYAREWERETDENKNLKTTTLASIKNEVTKMLQEEKQNGTLPLGWERFIDQISEASKANWKKTLRRQIKLTIQKSLTGKVDYSFTRPNRRQSIQLPILLPALKGEKKPRITCVLDTSGSMSQRELSLAFREVYEVLKIFRSPVSLIPCDSRAYVPITITKSTKTADHLKLPGGGGTNMIAGIRAAILQKPKPHIIIVLTDGYTAFPNPDFEVPVVWGIFSKKNLSAPNPACPPWKENSIVNIYID